MAIDRERPDGKRWWELHNKALHHFGETGEQLPPDERAELNELTEKLGVAEQINLEEEPEEDRVSLDPDQPDPDLIATVAGALVLLAAKAKQGSRKAAKAFRRLKAAASDPTSLQAILDEIKAELGPDPVTS